ncbi:hypothetical protein V3C99_007637, partial [Haemonchus contortus]|uniref:Serpentine receptor class gamma n=1 Tax=Haemonchus contortus TaxID=6289 RepID=A0A7I4YQJ8_HAECO
SNSSELPDLTEEYCIEHGVLLATSLYYRLTQTFSLIISTLSSSYTVYFLCRYFSKIPFFHRNLRTLFFSLTICCLFYSIVNIISKVSLHCFQGCHLALSFLYTRPCQIFLPKILYACMTVSYFFAYNISQFMMTSIVIERWIAFIFIRKYESGYTKLGPTLIALAIFISSLFVFILFNGQNFDGWHVNGRMLPSTTYIKTNIVLFSMLGSNIICLMLTITLHLLTPKRRIRMSLSSKFQRRENLIASKLFFYIATLQMTAFCCLQCATLYMRIYHSKDPMSIAYKESVDFFILYTLAMPVLSTLYFAKVKRQRIKDIRNHLDMKTIGSDGWTNYLTVIQKQWK